MKYLTRKQFRNNRSGIRAIAIVLLLVFSLGEMGYTASSLPVEEQPSAFQHYGRILEKYEGNSSKKVILIQDAHSVPSAQTSIRKLIDYYQSSENMPMVLAEGGDGAFQTALWRAFPDQKFLSNLFSGYEKQGELPGVVTASVLNQKKSLFFGVEDYSLYEKGLESYHRAKQNSAVFKTQLEILRKRINIEKKKLYSPQLLELDLLLTQFNAPHAEKSSHPKVFMELLKFLFQVSSPDKSKFPLMFELKQQSEKEKKNEKLIFPYAFDVVMKEWEAYKLMAKQSLFRNDKEKELDALNDRLVILEKLSELALTRDQWNQFQEEYALFHVSEFEKFLGPLKGVVSFNYQSQEEFYWIAEARDESLFENMNQILDEQKLDQCIFVVGGFHTLGLTSRMKAAGISYQLMAPKIKNQFKNLYQSQMQGNASWEDYFNISEDGKVNLFEAFTQSSVDQAMRQLLLSYGTSSISLWTQQLMRQLSLDGQLSESVYYLEMIENSLLKQLSDEEKENIQAEIWAQIDSLLQESKSQNSQYLDFMQSSLLQKSKTPPATYLGSIIPHTSISLRGLGKEPQISLGKPVIDSSVITVRSIIETRALVSASSLGKKKKRSDAADGMKEGAVMGQVSNEGFDGKVLRAMQKKSSSGSFIAEGFVTDDNGRLAIPGRVILSKSDVKNAPVKIEFRSGEPYRVTTGEDSALNRTTRNYNIIWESDRARTTRNERMLEELLEHPLARLIAHARGHFAELLDLMLQVFREEPMTEFQIVDFADYFRTLNLKEVAPSLASRTGVGHGHQNHIHLLQAIMDEEVLLSLRDDKQRRLFVDIYIKLVFKQLIQDPDGAITILNQRIAELSGDAAQLASLTLLRDTIKERIQRGLVFNPSHIKSELRPYQQVGAWFLRNKDRAYLGDQTGLGKSIQALAGMNPEGKTLLVVPASLADNWKEEIEKHVDENVLDFYDLTASTMNPAKRLEILEETKEQKRTLILVSIQTLRRFSDEAFELVNNGLNQFILDESQMASNFKGDDRSTNSEQAEAVQRIEAERIWWLSATPYNRSSEQLFAMLHSLAGDALASYQTYDVFRYTFPRGNIEGLRRLREVLRSFSMIRSIPMVFDFYQTGTPLDQQGLRMPNLRIVPYEFPETTAPGSVEPEGAYYLNEEQVKLYLHMVRDFRSYVEEVYNPSRSNPEDRINESSIHPFMKLHFIFWLMINPTKVGGTTEGNLWPALKEIVDQRLVEGKRGILLAKNRFAIDDVMSLFSDDYPMARIDGFVTGVARDDVGDALRFTSQDGRFYPVVEGGPRGRTIPAKTWERHRFQHGDARLVALNKQSGGLGLTLSRGSFEINIQVPETHTQRVQAQGRMLRADEENPRLYVEEITMVAKFPESVLARYSGTPEEFYFSRGTPSEIQMRRLGVQQGEFEFILRTADLLAQGVLNEEGLMEQIPGFMEDPIISHSKKRIPEKLQLLRDVGEEFLTLYQKARSLKEKKAVIEFALEWASTPELYKDKARELSRILQQDDIDYLWIVSSIASIPNKYARKRLLRNVIDSMITVFPKERVRLKDIYEELQWLEEEASWLVLALYMSVEGWRDGPALDILKEFLSEHLEGITNDRKRKQFLNIFLLRLISLDKKYWANFRQFIEQERKYLLDREAPFEERLQSLYYAIQILGDKDTQLVNQLLNPRSRKTKFKNRINKEYQRLLMRHFGLSSLLASKLLEFPNIETMVEMLRRIEEKGFEGEKDKLRFREIAARIADGTYFEWRNLQQGDRRSGDKVGYLEGEEEFWKIFTRSERVQVPITKTQLAQENQKQMSKLLSHVLQMILLDDRALVERIDSREVRQALRYNGAQITEKETKLRKSLLKAGAISDRRWKEGEWKTILRQRLLISERVLSEGENVTKRDLVQRLRSKLKVYSKAQDWTKFIAFVEKATRGTRALNRKQVKEMRDLVIRLRHRAVQTENTEVLQDLLDELDRLSSLRSKINKIEHVTVDFVNRPNDFLYRGMISPHRMDPFSYYGNPEMISTLVDDLGSRNTQLAVVRRGDRILSAARVKVRQGLDGKPVVFVERPIFQSSNDFEREILAGFALTKYDELRAFGARLAREVIQGHPEVELRTTGGYGDREFISSLFAIKRRSQGDDVSHPAFLLPEDLSEVLASSLGSEPVDSMIYLSLFGKSLLGRDSVFSSSQENVSWAGFYAKVKERFSVLKERLMTTSLLGVYHSRWKGLGLESYLEKNGFDSQALDAPLDEYLAFHSKYVPQVRIDSKFSFGMVMDYFDLVDSREAVVSQQSLEKLQNVLGEEGVLLLTVQQPEKSKAARLRQNLVKGGLSPQQIQIKTYDNEIDEAVVSSIKAKTKKLGISHVASFYSERIRINPSIMDWFTQNGNMLFQVPFETLIELESNDIRFNAVYFAPLLKAIGENDSPEIRASLLSFLGIKASLDQPIVIYPEFFVHLTMLRNEYFGQEALASSA